MNLTQIQQAKITDLYNAQVKCLPFVTYYIRTNKDISYQIRNSENNGDDKIVNLAIALLRKCPDDIILRKELFVAIRHLLATEVSINININSISISISISISVSMVHYISSCAVDCWWLLLTAGGAVS
jgi:hypothetical protein